MLAIDDPRLTDRPRWDQVPPDLRRLIKIGSAVSPLLSAYLVLFI